MVLIAIAFPSFRLLYLLDEVISPTISIKVVGHQWYWYIFPTEINLDEINNLGFLERSFTTSVSSLIFVLKRNVNTLSIPIISSINHDKTYSVINKGLNHPSVSLLSYSRTGVCYLDAERSS